MYGVWSGGWRGPDRTRLRQISDSVPYAAPLTTPVAPTLLIFVLNHGAATFCAAPLQEALTRGTRPAKTKMRWRSAR